MTKESRKFDRLNIRKKGVIEKRGIKVSCHLKDVSSDGSGLSFVSDSSFALYEHLIFDIKDYVDPKYQGVECVLKIVHIFSWHGQNAYGCEVVYSNEKFKEVVKDLNSKKSAGSRLKFLS